MAKYQIRDMQEGGESCKRRRTGEASKSNQKRTVAVIDGNRRVTCCIRRGPWFICPQEHKAIAPTEVTGRCASSSAGIMTRSSI